MVLEFLDDGGDMELATDDDNDDEVLTGRKRKYKRSASSGTKYIS